MYKLLIVDDELNIREGLSKYDWPSLGIELTGCCENGLEALMLMKHNPVDIVLTDIRMPFMGGLELAEQASHLYPFIKVVVLTGYSDFDYIQTSLRNGVDDYILKPSTPEELHSVFHHIIDKLDLEKQMETQTLAVMRKAQLCTKLIRREFLNRLFFLPISKEELEDGCELGELILPETPLSVCIFELDQVLRKNYSVKDWELILFAFENALSEIWEDKGLGYSIVDPDSGRCYLLATKERSGLIQLLVQIRELLYRFRGLFKTTLSVGIGTEVPDISEISMSCEQAETALKDSDHEEAISEFTARIISDTPSAPGDVLIQVNPSAESNGYIITAAQNYIQTNFRESITLTEIANHVHVNPSYLSFLFKEMTGENYLQYLTKCRVEEAVRILMDPKYKIYEIGDMVGYPNAQYFSVIFKKYKGVTPLEYRSKN